MTEPVQQRNLDLLNPAFRARFDAWLEAARAAAAPVEIGVHETLRSAERQAWLWASGRTRPGPIVTWTQHSKHQQGLAADWHLVRDGRADWDAANYRELYSLVPPADFGLRTLEGDLVHIEIDPTIAWGRTPPVAERLLIVLDSDGGEVTRLVLPPGADVLLRANSTGTRYYVRPA